MKSLLVAVNAKYIHSNLAVYCLKSFAASKGQKTEIAEYTINQKPGEVLRDLYKKDADVAAFSCYIWNIEFIKTLIRDYKKLRPGCEIWLGGPEVSYRAEEILKELPEVRGVMIGEGEETFSGLLALYEQGIKESCLNDIPGIAVRVNEKRIITTQPALPPDFSKLPFPYEKEDISFFKNRIIYYESSRGCPFSCAYCLSSLDKKVRFRDMELVKKELSFFLKQKVPQVKFIDRTFNINGPRTMELLQFIKENDNGTTNFHFEVAAELLTKEQTELLNSMRPGLVQLEIGVQSTNVHTLTAVHRKTELSVLKDTVAKVRSRNNVHIHLDLIAGLPKENLKSFRNSFDEVYRMKPHQLQLGFLKVLYGAPMEKMAAENGILYQSEPPYEVLATKWLSFDDVILLKKVEELVEVYYNSGQFVYGMRFLQHFVKSPFSLFEKLASFYDEKGYAGLKLSRSRRYEILYEFAGNISGLCLSDFVQILFFDFCLKEKPKACPEFFGQSRMEKQTLKEIYISFGVKREDEGMHDIEFFNFNPAETAENGTKTGTPCYILFSYEKRDAVFGSATVRIKEK